MGMPLSVIRAFPVSLFLVTEKERLQQAQRPAI